MPRKLEHKRAPTTVVIDGREYTLSELARKIGITSDCMRARYRKGLRGRDLLESPRRWSGDVTKLCREIAERTGIGFKTIISRYQRGMRGDDLARPKMSPRDHAGKLFLYHGEWHTISEIAKILGVKSSTVRVRVTDGYGGEVEGLLRDIGERTNKADLTDQPFGKLTAVREVGRNKYGRVLWECRCECGNPKPIVVSTANLRSGNTASCGCVKLDELRSRRVDRTGERYGRFLVLGPAPADGLWRVKCLECKTETEKHSNYLSTIKHRSAQEPLSGRCRCRRVEHLRAFGFPITFREIGELIGRGESNVRTLLQRGYSPEEILTMPRRRRTGDHAA